MLFYIILPKLIQSRRVYNFSVNRIASITWLALPLLDEQALDVEIIIPFF